MTRATPEQLGGKNRCAFLDMLAYSEIGREMLALSDDGYNVLVGSTPKHMTLFDNYADHPLPRVEDAVQVGKIKSTAAGRYQILSRYWPHYRAQLKLPDFGPVSQDRYALNICRERHALALIDAGEIPEAVEAVRNIWASLPGAGYGQHENSLLVLIEVYKDAGGVLV